MGRVIPFERIRASRDDRTYRPRDCSHRRIKLDSRGGIVSWAECGAALSPFWALTMLSEQYTVALKHIERLGERIALADARILELSTTLDREVIK